MALGRAVAAWQHVEMALSDVFIKLMRCRGSEEVASAAFYTPRDFSLQLNMTQNVAKLALSEAKFKEFKKLRDRCDAESQYRNAFVHFILMNVTPYEKYAFYLVPNPWNPAYRKPKALPHSIHIDHINAAGDRFFKLSNDLRDFLRQIPRRATRPGGHARKARQPSPRPHRRIRNPKSPQTPPRSSWA